MTRATRRFVVIALVFVLIVPTVLAGPLRTPGKARFAAPGDERTVPLIGVRSAGRALTRPDRAIPSVPQTPAGTKPKLARSNDDAQQAPTSAQNKLSGGGAVGIIGASFDGLTALWTEDTGGGVFEMFQRPIDGSGSAINLSGGFIAPGITEAQITPNDSAVVFIADAGFGPEVFSVPVGGGPVVSLTAGLPVGASSIGITPDSSTTFFFGADLAFSSGTAELWNAPIGSPGLAIQLSASGSIWGAAGGVIFVTPTNDSSTLIYATDTAAGPLDFFSVSVGVPGPGSEIQETQTISTGVTFINTASDSSTYYIIGDQVAAGVLDVYQQVIGAAPPGVVNTPMAGTGAAWLELSNDDSRLVYGADRDVGGAMQAYAVSTAGAFPDPGVSLSSPGFGLPNSFVNLNVDGTHAVWGSDEVISGEVELYGRPSDGSGPPVLLHDISDGSGDGLGFFTGSGYPTSNQRAYYPLFVGGAPPIQLHSVRADGTETFKTVNGPFLPGDSAWSAFLPGEGQRLTAYATGPVSGGGGSIDRVLVAALRADLPIEQANRTADLAGGETGIFDFFFAGSDNHVIFVQDADTLGLPELFSCTLDSDGDGVDNPLDNCRFVANGGQGLVPFPVALVLAPDRDTFSWGAGTYLDVFYAKGAIPVTASYTTTESGELFDADSLIDEVDPAPGTGYWYLFKIDCPGGDWGNAGRNTTLP